ncbi:MAG: hypothetical protein ACWA41_00825 [Putridiphycobacter sp.]
MKKLINDTYSLFYQKKTNSFKDKIYAVVILLGITFFSVFAFAQVL